MILTVEVKGRLLDASRRGLSRVPNQKRHPKKRAWETAQYGQFWSQQCAANKKKVSTGKGIGWNEKMWVDL